jgi:hypothetical protein
MSIINWEVYQKLKKGNQKIENKIKTYKKPVLGRIFDKICVFGQKLIKKPIFSLLFLMNLTLIVEYFRCTYLGEGVEMFRWVTTTSFLVFFGYLAFFNKN